MKKVFSSIICLLVFSMAFGKTVQIISFNDFHGAVAPNGSNPGMAKFVTAVKQQAEKYPESTVIVSAGDNYQGTALSVLTYGAPVNEMLKELKITASAVGNHEFDWGINEIKKWSKDGDFPFIAANIVNRKTGKTVSWAKPYVIANINGTKVAFIGLTTLESAFKTKKENVQNLTFLNPAKALQKWIDYLKAGKAPEGKPDAIIAVCHIASYQDSGSTITGESLQEMCKNVKGIDAIITGHSHELVCGKLNNIPVIQAYKYGRSLGILDLEFNEENSLVKVTPHTYSVTKNIADLKDDPEAEAIFTKYNNMLKKIDKTIAVAEDKLEHDNHYKGVSPLGALVCKIMADSTDSQIGITNGGGLRCNLKKGNITVSNIYELMPFDNYVVTCDLTGKQLKEIIEHGLFNPDPDTGDAQFYGIKVYYNSKAPYNNRIESMTLLDGTPVEMNKTYKVAATDFIVNGGDQYDFKGAANEKKHSYYT